MTGPGQRPAQGFSPRAYGPRSPRNAASPTTDDARIRDITQALPPEFADRQFTAREQGATEQQLQQIAADGLARMYSAPTTAEPRA
ncbi:hypothetical protein AB0N62_29130 [Streptomyces sp. NPDC093982]|uniref:hypothetical protein n=1 Tax=Streptomyces sp. NPDC093982 TaxID=3155077 RepID=UPI003434B693